MEFVDAIPKTLVGKPLRRVIREREAAGGGGQREKEAQTTEPTWREF